MPLDCLIRGGTLVLEHTIISADVAIDSGSIVAIECDLRENAREVIDATGLTIFPGVVDTHVHFNEPGRTEWEGAATGSAALAAGGGTCYCDMPLNASPPTLDGRSFDLKRAALERSSHVDFALWGGICPHNLNHLEELAERGVIGFKAFMCNSGIDDFPSVDEHSLARGMEVAARLNLPVALHAEDEGITRQLAHAAINAGRTTIRDYLNSRPIRAEVMAIERAVALAEQTGCSLHVVHVSSGAGACVVLEARLRGANVTCETCPHYLLFTDLDLERIGAAAKCAPPIRTAIEREFLWQALANGQINLVASDHSPAPWAMKESSNFFAVWGGIAGCQLLLGLLLQEGHVRRGIPLYTISRWTSHQPADRYRLKNKGRIAVGADADLALVDLSQSVEVTRDDLHDHHRISPYLGQKLAGRIRRTMVRGRTVFADGCLAGSPVGQFIRPAL